MECRAVPLDQGGFRVMMGADTQRVAPLSIPLPAINLACAGPRTLPWEPDAAQAVAIATEAAAMAD
eukprot:7294942-Lingulodinium_polyedra.AAC.1